jgi:hypothetical protein
VARRSKWWDEHLSIVIGCLFGLIYLTSGTEGFLSWVHYAAIVVVVLSIAFMIVAICIPRRWYENRQDD